ncbi:MAG TPA: hypothetical protein DCY55_06685, partial [Gammaproteobacteria bacterium]|nr:hypothetical protein [Gammaproteobacteria bacterium]
EKPAAKVKVDATVATSKAEAPEAPKAKKAVKAEKVAADKPKAKAKSDEKDEPKAKPAAKKPAAKKAAPKKVAPKKAAAEGDDLTELDGVGPVIKGKLYAEGVTTFAQIAAWTDAEKARIDELLSFKGRIDREDWIGQAKAKVAG